jgi:signal transduction histidine kinase
MDATCTPTTSRARDSLRWRLPLVIAAVIVVVVGTFLGSAYREVKASLLQAAGVRAQGAANQLASLLAQSTQQRLGELRRIATHASLRDYLEHPGETTRQAARLHLSGLKSPNPQVIELWTRAGDKVLTLPTPPDAESALPIGSAPVAAESGRLQVYRNTVFTDSITSVESELPADDGGPRTRVDLGSLVVRRPISVSSNANTLTGLVGNGAIVKVGNTGGSLWTDLASIVDAPPVDLLRVGLSDYQAADGQRHLGAMATISGTPWSLWVEFAQPVVLAPAWSFLRRMVVIALGVVLVAGIFLRVMTERTLTRLSDLTQASEAMAGGEYSRRVTIGRCDEIGRLGLAFNAMTERVEHAHRELEDRVRKRTASLEETSAMLEQRAAELVAVNQELEAFSYSVSHDLRAPLRHIDGFAALLRESTTSSLDADGHRLLRTIIDAATRMGRLIDDLLAFSRVGRKPLERAEISLSPLIREVQQEIMTGANGHVIAWHLHDLPVVQGDKSLLRLVFVNLMSNAVKYSSRRAKAEIEIGTVPGAADEIVLFVRDNGVGFDMQYAHKLFGVFQRLHTTEEFEGTGIGLANVRRIVDRHGGRVWAEGALDRGASFYVSLPNGRAS